MNNVRSSSRKRIPALQNPNDPRWDIRIGIPLPKLIEIIALEQADNRAPLAVKGGGCDA